MLRGGGCELWGEIEGWCSPTFLEDRGSVNLYNSGLGIFVSLAVTHGEKGQLLSFINGSGKERWQVMVMLSCCGGTRATAT